MVWRYGGKTWGGNTWGGNFGIRESGNFGIGESGNPGIRESENPGIREAGNPESGNVRIQRSGNLGIPRFGNLGIPGSGNLGILGSGNLGIPGSGNLGIPGGGTRISHPPIGGGAGPWGGWGGGGTQDLFFSVFFEKYWKRKKRELRLQPQAFFLSFSKLGKSEASGDPALRIDTSGTPGRSGPREDPENDKYRKWKKKRGCGCRHRPFFFHFQYFRKT